MFKMLLFVLLAFAMMLQPAPARATTSAPAVAAGTALLAPGATVGGFFRRTPRKGRPNYMAYKGAARKKMKKLGPVRRWKLRRKAQAKRRTHVPNVKAGAPTRVMKK